MKKIAILLIIVLSTLNSVVAQTELRYEHYTIVNGLSGNYTTCAEQDKYGLMWVGSIDGLSCFNGYEFTTYYNNGTDLNSVSENFINDILIDSKGTVWVATNQGLNKFKRASNNFQRYFCHTSHVKNAKENLIVNSITEIDNGNLWIGTNKGIRILNTATNEITQPDFKDAALKKFVNDGIVGIYFDSKGRIWLGSYLSAGLRLVDKKTLAPIPFFPENKKNQLDGFTVTGFFEDSKSVIWILCDNGLYSYETSNNLFKRYVTSERPGDTLAYSATSIIEDKDGVIWTSLAANPPYYTSIAKVSIETATLKIYHYVDNDERGLAWGYVSFIFQDRSGIFWIGTSRGLDKMDPLCQQFKLYQQYTNLKYSQYQNIYSMAKDADIIWLGTDGEGLMKYTFSSKKFEQVLTSSDLGSGGVWAIIPNDDGSLLLGSSDGIFLFNYKTGNLQIIVKSPQSAFSTAAQSSCLVKGEGDDIWVTWNGGGLTRYNLKTKVRKDYKHNVSDKNSICSNAANVVFKDSKGRIWVGSADGVNVFSFGLPGRGLDCFNPADETFTHFSHNDEDSTSLSNDNVICIAEDNNGMLWIGTRNGGLNKFNPETGKFKSYTKNEGMPSNFISAILVDDSNRIWTSSYTNGIACLDPITEKIRVFDVTYGLQNIRFNRQSSYEAEDGELFFGGVSGFNSFYPSKIKFNTQAPDILITGIKINNKIYNSDSSVLDIKTLTLNYNENDLQFDFAAMNFSQSYKNLYAYQLEGYDDKWIMAGTDRTTKYTNLDAGTYTFKVKACNNDGVWNETGAAITIVILPPWWKTWWAYMGYILALTGIVIGYAFVRAESLRKENKKLEEKVTTRTKELEVKTVDLQNSLSELKVTQTQLVQQEKLASLGALTAGIAHEIKNPLNFVNNFSELSNELVDEFIQTTDEQERKVIGEDLKLNLSKINEHGKRADSIVKNMLAHSRSGSSEKQLTDINQLCDEYFNLAFHGKRASNPGFNCEMIKQFDINLPQIICVTQDISRVILNLISNAFDAVREKEGEGERAAYRPTVQVNTKSSDQHICISIKDNGKGIPPHIKEKIFEPFFTTKAAGHGTGLGLSLSNDIIKAHGGELKVESKVGEGSEFTVTLPL